MHCQNEDKDHHNLKEQTIMSVQHINKATFLEKVANFEQNPTEWKFLGERPAIIDFYAEWCNPCKQLAPVLESLADEYKGKVDIYKVNVDEETELASVFGIRSIPTLLFAPMDGQPQITQGVAPRNTLVDAIEEILLK